MFKCHGNFSKANCKKITAIVNGSNSKNKKVEIRKCLKTCYSDLSVRNPSVGAKKVEKASHCTCCGSNRCPIDK